MKNHWLEKVESKSLNMGYVCDNPCEICGKTGKTVWGLLHSLCSAFWCSDHTQEEKDHHKEGKILRAKLQRYLSQGKEDLVWDTTIKILVWMNKKSCEE